jgi:ATP synthase protein I
MDQKPNDKGSKKLFDKVGQARLFATAWSIGLSVVIAILLGLGLGMWLDSKFGTKPWLMIVGLLCGIVAGFRNIFILAERLEKSQRSSPNDDR